MIARLHGKLIEKNPPQIVIDCQGVGYEVDVPMSTFYNLPEIGEDLIILTEMIVREDASLLFGFLTKNEKNLFRQLLKVNGIGPRTALSMLSSMNAVELSNAIATEQVALLTKVPGIGKKTAERLVLELKDKVSATSIEESIIGTKKEILQALISLGFNEREARSSLKNLSDGIEVSEGIRLALQHLSKKG